MSLDRARALIADLAAEVDPRPGEIRLEMQGQIARLWIDNPSARNAITVGMMTQLADAVEALGGWPGSVVVLASANPGVFCSGGHLGQVRRAVSSPERARAMAAAMTEILDGLLELPQISVAALGGAAIGGGAEISTATDFRVGSPEARIHFVHASLGIAPGWGGTGRLVRHIGRRSALAVLARAAPVNASDALGMGLLDAIAPDALAAADALIRPFIGHAPEALRAVKKQVIAVERGDGGEGIAFSEVWGGPAHVAALEALRARR